MSARETEVGERRALAGSGLSLRAAIVVVFSFFFLGALLNGRHLHEDASLRPYGKSRDIWMSATAPLADAAEFLRLDRIRGWIESLRSNPS